MAKIYAPNDQYTGVSAGVAFVRGVGETDDPHRLEWFRRKGYRVEEAPQQKALSEMTKAELLAYAAEAGIEVDETAKKAEILAAIQAANADEKDEKAEGEPEEA